MLMMLSNFLNSSTLSLLSDKEEDEEYIFLSFDPVVKFSFGLNPSFFIGGSYWLLPRSCYTN